MDRRLLELVPKRYLCPLCGEWHDYDLRELEWYDSRQYRVKLECPNWPQNGYVQPLYFYFEYGFCCYSTEERDLCGDIVGIRGEISIKDMVEHADEPIITFEAEVELREDRLSHCQSCKGKKICHYRKIGENCSYSHNHPMKVMLGFEFDRDEYLEISEVMQKAKAEKKAAISSGMTIKSETTATRESKMFGLNIEFGQNNDANLVSTLMGVAVKNNNGWRIYDKSKKQITDVGNLQIGNFPIFIMPTTKLIEGDLIKENGGYYYVISTENDTTKILCPNTGEIKIIIPTKNIFGINIYSKVVALCDCFSEDRHKISNEKLALMSLAFGQPNYYGNSMNQLIPLFLLNNKYNKDIDFMQIIFMLFAMNNANLSKSADSYSHESDYDDDDESDYGPEDELPF